MSRSRKNMGRITRGRRQSKPNPARVLLADVPWPFRDKLPGGGRGAAKHYKLLSIEDIARFPLPPLAKDCVLVFWVVASMPEEALFIVRAWGFKAKAELIWVKLTNDRKKVRIGMGRTVRNAHERAIIAVRGKPKRKSASESSIIMAPRGRHSEKPAEVYELIERLYPGPYVELFGRKNRRGWTVYGNEVGRHP